MIRPISAGAECRDNRPTFHPIEKMTKENRSSFYDDLAKFTLEWMKKRNEEGEKPKLSEVVGGLEMVKTEIYWTQTWFIDKTINKQLKEKVTLLISKLGGKDITIHPDGTIIMKQFDDSPQDKSQQTSL